MSPAGPLAIIAVAVIVLTVLWKTATPLMAIIIAAALLTGVFLLVLMYGIKPRRHREGTGSPALWRRRRF